MGDWGIFWIEVLDEAEEWSASEVGGYDGLVSWRRMTKCRRKRRAHQKRWKMIYKELESIAGVGNFGGSCSSSVVVEHRVRKGDLLR